MSVPCGLSLLVLVARRVSASRSDLHDGLVRDALLAPYAMLAVILSLLTYAYDPTMLRAYVPNVVLGCLVILGFYRLPATLPPVIPASVPELREVNTTDFDCSFFGDVITASMPELRHQKIELLFCLV